MNDAPRFYGMERQRQIYQGGLAGRQSRIPFGTAQLIADAREHMSKAAFAYVAGGAGDERTIAANRAAFDLWEIVPRVLRDGSSRDMSVELFDRVLPTPVLLAPIGVLELVHPAADLAVARTAARHDIPMVFSNQASVAMEACAAEMGSAPRWFQLYWSKSDALVASLVSRAEACGCEAIVVTLDTTMLGWRPRDLDLAWLPFLHGMGIAQYSSDPVFQQQISSLTPGIRRDGRPPLNRHTIAAVLRLMRRYPGGLLHNLRTRRPLAAVQHFIDIYSRPNLTWEHLAFLREHTSLPILLKGILHPEDARYALAAGVDGIIVSNHGGRQLDGATATLTALPAIVRAVDGAIPVLLDSGIRNGADIFKALALGATAVCLGRPYVYGLAIDGERGVDAILSNILADFDLTMGLSGCRSVLEIAPDTLRMV